MTALVILAIIYVIGVALFTLYASVMSKGWNDTYALPKSLAWGARWPWTLLSLLFAFLSLWKD